MSRYPEMDLTGVRRKSIQDRIRKVDQTLAGRPAGDPSSFEDFWNGLPGVLAAHDLKSLVERVVEARRNGRPVLLFMGGHVVKTGVTPYVIRLMEEGLLTLVASHGAGLVHDVEWSLFGRTSSLINSWTKEAVSSREGLGEGIGRRLLSELERKRLDPDTSWLAAAYRREIPATLHVSIGTDIYQQHPEFEGAALGEASARDFRILAHHVSNARGGVVLNWGSAVLMPEVFLKALSVARNLGHPAVELTTAAFDFMKHYRPLENIVRRPTLGSGWGVYLVGHHEILIPLFTQGVILRWGGGRAGQGSGS
jgi:deoxyhypusine synthase